MTDLEDFMSKNEPKYQLKIYKNEILELLECGYIYADILRSLDEKKKLKVSESTLKRNVNFFRKEQDKPIITRVKTENKNESFKRPKLTPEELKAKLKADR